MELKGKNVLITGAAVRVGRAMAEAVAKTGATVIVHYGSSDAEAHSLQSELSSLGHPIHLLKTDLARPQEVAKLIARASETGPLFALVNSAAIFENRDLATTDLASWQR